MEPHFGRAAIIGVGLLGSSLGLGLKARRMAEHITGVGHRQSSLDTALEAGAIDEAFFDLAQAVRGADLIVVATPAALVTEKLDAILDSCSSRAVVTDVASTKRVICRHAEQRWPKPRRFVGSHPMAGSEKFGAEHGRPDFFENSVCLVERNAALDLQARNTVTGLWHALGATVVDLDPDTHDAILARTSHVPHILAAAIAEAADNKGDVSQFIGNGFRDMTRIAASRPEVWRDICMTNREAVLEALDEFRAHLGAFAEALRAEDAEAIEELFKRGNTARNRTAGS